MSQLNHNDISLEGGNIKNQTKRTSDVSPSFGNKSIPLVDQDENEDEEFDSYEDVNAAFSDNMGKQSVNRQLKTNVKTGPAPSIGSTTHNDLKVMTPGSIADSDQTVSKYTSSSKSQS